MTPEELKELQELDEKLAAANEGFCIVYQVKKDGSWIETLDLTPFQSCAVKAAGKNEAWKQKAVEVMSGIVGVIKSHDIESYSCDRDGNAFCDCLDSQANKLSTLLREIERGA